MIGYLRGSVLKSDPDRLLLDVRGVGYEIHVPLSTFYEIERAEDRGAIGLHIHTHLRDDGLSLFGFWTENERTLFERLISVGGIGPKLARVILSGLPVADLLGALQSGDLARLSSIPGVGKKTAQRMVLELGEKVADLIAGEPSALPPPAADDDLVSALINLGYRKKDADAAVLRCRRDLPEAPFPDLLRASLKLLSRT